MKLKYKLFLFTLIFITFNSCKTRIETFQLTGIICDENNNPISGCEVFTEAHKLSVSDLNGHFNLLYNISEIENLTFVKENYEIKKINTRDFNTRGFIYIKLKSKKQLLKEVFIQFRNEEYDDAITQLNKLIPDEKSKYQIDFYKTWCLIKLKDFDKAQENLEMLKLSRYKTDELMKLDCYYKNELEGTNQK